MITAMQHALADVRITVICENTAMTKGTLGEQGLAMLVETPAGRVLLDTGGGHTLLHNAKAIDVNLATIDAVALSHGHYDHSGGLADLLRLRGEIGVYAHPAVFSRRYSILVGEQPRPNGLQLAKDEYRHLGARWHLAEEPQSVLPGVWLTGTIGARSDLEWQDEGFLVGRPGGGEGLELDTIPDDQSLVVSTDAGLLVISGCAHAGPVATVKHVKQLAPDQPVVALIGGMHLYRAGDARLEPTAQALYRDLGVLRVWAGHCTGFRAQVALANEYGPAFSPLGSGLRIEPGAK